MSYDELILTKLTNIAKDALDGGNRATRFPLFIVHGEFPESGVHSIAGLFALIYSIHIDQPSTDEDLARHPHLKSSIVMCRPGSLQRLIHLACNLGADTDDRVRQFNNAYRG